MQWKGIKILKNLRDYLIREILMSEFSLCNIGNSFSLLLLALLRRINIISEHSLSYEKVREALRICRRNFINKKYGIKLIYPSRYAPVDIYWRDYFVIPSFLEESSVVIDIGASIGEFSIIMAKFFGAKKVIAIEPDEIFFYYFINNIKINSLNKIIVPINIALGDREGYIYLYKEGIFPSIKSKKGSLKAYRSSKLDNIVKGLKLEKVDLIKIDTEGSEVPILKGGECTIKSFKPKIIIEVHSRRDRVEILRFLAKYGYKLLYEKVNFSEGLGDLDYISVMYLRPASNI